MNRKVHLILIPLVALAATGYYTYFGQMVPQKEVHPPKEIEINKNMTTSEMVEVGQKLFEGKGTCIACHKLSGGTGRFPDLGNVGGTAASRKLNYSDIDYLSESLYRPNDFIVEGFNPGMPQINKPPIELTDIEIKAVIAYLQSLGATPTITMETKLKWEGEGGGGSSQAPSEKSSDSTTSNQALGPKELMGKYLCATCHSLDAPIKIVGPSLFDIGKNLNKAQLYEAIMDPDANVAEGFPAGMMGGTLKSTGFYEKVSSAELKELVNYLSERKGK